MKTLLPAFFCCLALAAQDGPLQRLMDPKLTSAARNDACFELRGVHSEEAIEAMRSSLRSSELRACAAANLREAGAVRPLSDALEDPSPEVRAMAARELGLLARPDSMPALAKAARDPNALVSSNAVFALSQYRDREVLPYLLDLAKSPGITGALALSRAAEFKDPRALAIARQLAEGADVPVRMYALNVIGELGDKSDLPQLQRIAAKNERLSQTSRGFGLLPAIDLSRAAKTAMARIGKRRPAP